MYVGGGALDAPRAVPSSLHSTLYRTSARLGILRNGDAESVSRNIRSVLAGLLLEIMGSVDVKGTDMSALAPKRRFSLADDTVSFRAIEKKWGRNRSCVLCRGQAALQVCSRMGI